MKTCRGADRHHFCRSHPNSAIFATTQLKSSLWHGALSPNIRDRHSYDLMRKLTRLMYAQVPCGAKVGTNGQLCRFFLLVNALDLGKLCVVENLLTKHQLEPHRGEPKPEGFMRGVVQHTTPCSAERTINPAMRPYEPQTGLESNRTIVCAIRQAPVSHATCHEHSHRMRPYAR